VRDYGLTRAHPRAAEGRGPFDRRGNHRIPQVRQGANAPNDERALSGPRTSGLRSRRSKDPSERVETERREPVHRRRRAKEHGPRTGTSSGLSGVCARVTTSAPIFTCEWCFGPARGGLRLRRDHRGDLTRGKIARRARSACGGTRTCFPVERNTPRSTPRGRLSRRSCARTGSQPSSALGEVLDQGTTR